MKRKLLMLLALLLLWSVPTSAQVTITYTFVNGQTADADQVNTNFTALGSAALNRTGGTITGNIAVNNGVTIDGIDISAVLGGTGTPTFSSVTTGTLAVSNTGATAIDVAGGINAGTGNVGIVDTTGKIPAISSTYFASLDGSALTNLTGANLGSVVPTSLGGTGGSFSGVAQGGLLYFSATGSMSQLPAGLVGQFLRSGGAGANISWSSDGSTFTALNATALTSGTVPSARISGTYSSAVTFSSGSNAFVGASFQGGHLSTDGSTGITSTTCNFTASITVKNGLIVGGSGC